MVALKSDGTVLAWGDNSFGELGNGTTTRVTGPVQVTGLTGATQVAAGAEAGFAVHVPQPVPPVPDLTGDTPGPGGPGPAGRRAGARRRHQGHRQILQPPRT